MNLDLEVGQIFLATCGLAPDFIEQSVVDGEFGIHRPCPAR